MTEYKEMERDFITRTLHLIDQYEGIPLAYLKPQSFEATLLINCLLGLLIYPQQIALVHNQQKDDLLFSNWLTSERLMSEVSADWHIYSNDVISPGYSTEKGDKDLGIKSHNPIYRIAREKLTVRQLLRQMRNAVAHAWFHVESRNGLVHSIVFHDKYDPAGMGFHIEVPVAQLRAFVRKLATSALNQLHTDGVQSEVATE